MEINLYVEALDNWRSWNDYMLHVSKQYWLSKEHYMEWVETEKELWDRNSMSYEEFCEMLNKTIYQQEIHKWIMDSAKSITRVKNPIHN